MLIGQWTVIVEFVNDSTDATKIRLQRYAGEKVKLGTTAYENLFLKMELDGPSVRDAINRALGRLEDDILGGLLSPYSVSAYPKGLREPVPELAGLSEVARLLGVSRQRAGQLAQQQSFPAPVARLAMGPVFSVHAVREFEREWARSAGRPRVRSEHDSGLSVTGERRFRSPTSGTV